MDELLVLRISDNTCVDLNGEKLYSVTEVANSIKKVLAESPDVTISIESSGPRHYESIGKAIYGSVRAGVARKRIRILNDGKPWEA